MPTILTQTEFDAAATAWATFIGKASASDVQALFQTGTGPARQYQTFVSFDLADTIPLLLSTVGIARVAARFVLAAPSPSGVLPAAPRFRVVLYATDQLGGRISAYYQGQAAFRTVVLPTLPPTLPHLAEDMLSVQGLVPFSLIKNWLTAWGEAAVKQHLSPAMFATGSYGPLQGYVFELGDFMDQLFSAPGRGATMLFLNFGLKSYYPAQPEGLAAPAQTFGLVVRLYTPGKTPDDTGAAGGTESGPSYDLAQASPPY